jgi:hypothetical protein
MSKEYKITPIEPPMFIHFTYEGREMMLRTDTIRKAYDHRYYDLEKKEWLEIGIFVLDDGTAQHADRETALAAINALKELGHVIAEVKKTE